MKTLQDVIDGFILYENEHSCCMISKPLCQESLVKQFMTAFKKIPYDSNATFFNVADNVISIDRQSYDFLAQSLVPVEKMVVTAADSLMCLQVLDSMTDCPVFPGYSTLLNRKISIHLLNKISLTLMPDHRARFWFSQNENCILIKDSDANLLMQALKKYQAYHDVRINIGKRTRDDQDIQQSCSMKRISQLQIADNPLHLFFHKQKSCANHLRGEVKIKSIVKKRGS